MSLPDQCCPLGESEIRVVAGWRQLGRSLLLTGDATASPSPADLDRAFLAWQGRDPAARRDPNDIVNGLGVLLGDLFVIRGGCFWVVVNDLFGVSLAVFHEPSGMAVNVREAIAKRLNVPEAWIRNFFETIMARLEQERQGSTVPPPGVFPGTPPITLTPGEMNKDFFEPPGMQAE